METGRPFFLPAANTDNSQIINHYQKSLHGAPGYIGPGGAVPEAAQEKDDESIEKHTGPSLTAAAQRNIYISDKKPGQRDMPPLPELFNAAGTVWGIKV